MKAAEPLSLPLPAADFIPQRPPMLLVDELVSHSGEAALVTTVLPQPHQWATELLVEMMAQACGVLNGYEKLKKGLEPAIGYLAAIEELEIQIMGEKPRRLLVEVRKTMNFGPVAVMETSIGEENGRRWGGGTIKVWEET